MNPNIDPKTVNYVKLRAERKELDLQILALKKELRSPWGDSAMGAVQNQLRRLKVEATRLCILRAYLRGKQHLGDAVFCREIAQQELSRFRKVAEFHPTAEAAR